MKSLFLTRQLAFILPVFLATSAIAQSFSITVDYRNALGDRPIRTVDERRAIVVQQATAVPAHVQQLFDNLLFYGQHGFATPPNYPIKVVYSNIRKEYAAYRSLSALAFKDTAANIGYILLDASRFQHVAPNNTAKMLILAHELGHHLGGHFSANAALPTVIKEHMADFYAGRVLNAYYQNLLPDPAQSNAFLHTLVKGMKSLYGNSSAKPYANYPSAKERSQLIELGFREDLVLISQAELIKYQQVMQNLKRMTTNATEE